MIQRFQRKCNVGQSLYHVTPDGYITNGLIYEMDETLIKIRWSETFQQGYSHNDQIWRYITMYCTTEAI